MSENWAVCTSKDCSHYGMRPFLVTKEMMFAFKGAYYCEHCGRPAVYAKLIFTRHGSGAIWMRNHSWCPNNYCTARQILFSDYLSLIPRDRYCTTGPELAQMIRNAFNMNMYRNALAVGVLETGDCRFGYPERYY